MPDGAHYPVEVDGGRQPTCCPGCQAVATAVLGGGLGDYYRHRTGSPARVSLLGDAWLREARVYDDPRVQSSFVRRLDDGTREAALILEGIVCAACVWLNEHYLSGLQGVLEVEVNYSTHRARVRWDEDRIQLSEILGAVAHIGYLAHPYDPSRQEQLLEAERRRQLRRLGVAGVLGMQVMMLAVALYAGDWFGIDARFRGLLEWSSLLLAAPVLVFAARPFFRGAWRDLRLGRAGMDVPVTLGLGIAFAGSVWSTLTGSGHVYYDSVVMFVFLLLLARYGEFVARRRSAGVSEALLHAVPAVATRLGEGPADQESVPVADLQPGDRVLVRPGEGVPADGRVLSGRSTVDEALLTGESTPLARGPGDPLVGGSINVESPLEVRVEHSGSDTVLSHVLRLVERARGERPGVARLADRVAAWFVGAVLLLALGVAGYWWQAAPQLWLPVTVSVLVVTCPCALSLATPTVITAATGALTHLGLITTRGHALESLARSTHVVFDKTGTLTRGRLEVTGVHPVEGQTREACLELAAALESQSEHPVAHAIARAWAERSLPPVDDPVNVPGGGLSGVVSGTRWTIGGPDFVAGVTGHSADPTRLAALRAGGETVVALADDGAVRCLFTLGDQLREGARELVAGLQAQKKSVLLLSGDHRDAVERVANETGVDEVAWGLTPDEKLARVRELQFRGAVVAMVGDGVNDAPVLSGAQVSIAMGGGAHLARASADMILLNADLPRLLDAFALVRRSLRVMRQNLLWAVGYNLLALPAAAMGYVAPWMAAVGMSASSLLVVLNAVRLNPRG